MATAGSVGVFSEGLNLKRLKQKPPSYCLLWSNSSTSIMAKVWALSLGKFLSMITWFISL